MNQIKKGLSMVKNSVKGFVKEEDGVGVVEMILIVVVLIALVVIFKEEMEKVGGRAFGKVNNSMNRLK